MHGQVEYLLGVPLAQARNHNDTSAISKIEHLQQRIISAKQAFYRAQQELSDAEHDGLKALKEFAPLPQ